jgi:gas vesicle protein
MRRMFGFLMGVFVGGLVGSVLALLMAPESGEDLRNQLRARGQGFVNDIRHSADSRRIELRNRLETLRSPRME